MPARLALLLSLLLLSLGVASCESTRACRQGTLYVAVRFDSASANADGMAVVVTIDGAQRTITQKARLPGTTAGTLEIDFPNGYPAGRLVSVEIFALLGSTPVGEGIQAMIALADCTSLSIAVDSESLARDAAAGSPQPDRDAATD